ncbi:IS66 family insertion sequence element accessory protein TnpB [Paenibacillus sp. S-12]|uniref:IS66 family insertion sequence element accessory protein TnpB n=1 Tax=Paenibacillus sp. S-12 TaxID=3031371 RepID=UPI00338E2209
MQRGFQLDLFSPSLFVFYNRESNKLKILFWNTMELGSLSSFGKGDIPMVEQRQKSI